MDVPFISSGALNRAHYALVRKVEDSPSESTVNQVLEAEVQSVRLQLAQHSLSLKRIKEALIILLYCSITATPLIFPKGAFDFAFPHALNMAEAGTIVEDKRIGYLFCAEMMHKDHGMRLMLVNTLRKDLEDDSISRICLALDNIIASSSVDIIPAVQWRLFDLLSHNHPSVRRRALYAVRSLSQHEPSLLVNANSRILRRLKDPDSLVAGAAMRIAETLSQNGGSAPAVQDAINDAFEIRVATYISTGRGSVLTGLRTIHSIGLRRLSLPSVFHLLEFLSTGRNKAVLLGLYRLFREFDAATLRALEEQTQVSAMGIIRNYLTSKVPNELYLFLSCLECLNTGLWAGTSEAIPTAIEAWEVEQIIQLLDSNDGLIRKKTFHLLANIDNSILNTYYAQALSAAAHTTLSLKEANERAKRLLEIVEVLSSTNGEFYATQVTDILGQLEPRVAGSGILDSAVESALTHIRFRERSFQVSCAATMLTILGDTDVVFGPTMMVISAALATEYSRLVSISPTQLLLGICHRLKGNPTAVQEPCLLAMLRISADCEIIPEEVIEAVSETGQNANRHIRRQSDQFLFLIGHKELLMEILSASRSLSLPDFLEALQSHGRNVGPGNQNMSGVEPPRVVLSTGRLRYEAYDTPQVTPSLRTRRASSPQGSIVGSRSDAGSTGEHSTNLPAAEPASHAMTPGDLALAACSGELGLIAKGQVKPKISTMTDGGESCAHVDLIAFDSPFVVEPSEGGSENAQQELDFESMWNSEGDPQSARGWCGITTDGVVGRLRGINGYRLQIIPANVTPFKGDLKVAAIPRDAEEGGRIALLRLKESDEDSCLWRMRCADGSLRGRVKELLGE